MENRGGKNIYLGKKNLLAFKKEKKENIGQKNPKNLLILKKTKQ
jgi:hypothetical protein